MSWIIWSNRGIPRTCAITGQIWQYENVCKVCRKLRKCHLIVYKHNMLHHTGVLNRVAILYNTKVWWWKTLTKLICDWAWENQSYLRTCKFWPNFLSLNFFSEYDAQLKFWCSNYRKFCWYRIVMTYTENKVHGIKQSGIFCVCR